MAQIEINDLVGKAIANASERRKLAETGLSDLSGQEMNQITGGALLGVSSIKYTTPLIVGLIALPTNFDSFSTSQIA